MGQLTPRDAAPTFELRDQSRRTVALEGFRGRKVLVYFYPKAGTPGCTTQSCAVRDAREDLAGLGVDVLGISGEKSMYGKTYMGIVRSAFLVDEQGRIEHAWHKVSPGDTVPNVRSALAP